MKTVTDPETIATIKEFEKALRRSGSEWSQTEFGHEDDYWSSFDPFLSNPVPGAVLGQPNLSGDPINVTSELTDGRSSDGPVGQATRPDDGMTARSLLRRALEASRNPIDMQRFEQLAQDRNRAGDLSTLTSLYAGEAGPRYADYKENYLKKAMAEKGQQQLGDYGFASGGQFYETPGIQQDREAETDIAAARILAPQESLIRKENLAAQQEALIKAGQTRERTAKTLDQNAFVADAIGMLDEVPDTAALRKVGSLIYGSDSYDLGEVLNTVKANIGFSELNAIRSAIGNKTGGALGNVTERELKFLQQVRGSLDLGQSKEQLRKNLENISNSYQNVIRALNGEETEHRPSEGYRIYGVSVMGDDEEVPDGAVTLMP